VVFIFKFVFLFDGIKKLVQCGSVIFLFGLFYNSILHIKSCLTDLIEMLKFGYKNIIILHINNNLGKDFLRIREKSYGNLTHK